MSALSLALNLEPTYHHGGNTSLDCVGKRPHVELVHSSIINVCGNSLDGLVVGRLGGVPLSLLFITDPMLCTSLDTSLLQGFDSFFHGDTGKIWVGREAFPSTTSIGGSSKRSSLYKISIYSDCVNADHDCLPLVLEPHGHLYL
jgi:hypothetical protein